MSESQFLLLKDQLKVVSESSDIERRPSLPLQSIELPDSQVEVIENLRGKMKGFEQTIVTEGKAVKGFRDMVVGLSEKVDSSLGTALTSRFNTSGPVSGERINLIKERDVVRKGIERSEKLTRQILNFEKKGTAQNFKKATIVEMKLLKTRQLGATAI